MVLKWCEDNHWRNQHIIYVKSWEPEAEAWLVVSYKLKDTHRCIIWIRMVTGRPPHDHVRPAFHELHWLPIPLRIKFKVALLMFLVHTNQCPAYISETMTSVSCGPSQRRVPTPLMARITLRQGQGPSLVRKRSQLPDLPSGTLSLNISVLPPISTVLNDASLLIILTFILLCLRLFLHLLTL